MSIVVELKHPVLPEGVYIRADIGLGSSGRVTADLAGFSETIKHTLSEVAKLNGKTPVEVVLEDRMALIERGIINSLPADIKLGIANEITRS